MRLRFYAWTLCGVAWLPAATSTPPVEVTLQASFPPPPFLIELIETAAEENATSYAPILDRISKGHVAQASTDEGLYNRFIRLLKDDGHISTADALATFNLALAIRSVAPRVETHYQYYRTYVEPTLRTEQTVDCEFWVEHDGRQYCDPQLSDARGRVRSRKILELPFDRLLAGQSDGEGYILYADISSPSFATFYSALSKTLANRRAAVCLRYKPPLSISRDTLTVAGYGVDLALKRTDYIVIDDRENTHDGEAKSDHLALPSNTESGLKPLNASELADLSIKTASYIMRRKDPLMTLYNCTQDFPKYAQEMSIQEISEDFVQEHNKNRHQVVPAGYNVVWVNGLQADTRNFNAFYLLRVLRKERNVVKQMVDLGITPGQAIRILSHPATAAVVSDDQPQRYDMRDEIEGGKAVVWLNDLEKDKKYQAWPTKVAAYVQRTFPGQLPAVRSNIFTLVVPVNLAQADDVLIVIEALQSFVKRKLPIRFGVVPMIQSTAASSQAEVFYHLQETYGLSTALQYLGFTLSGKAEVAASEAAFNAATEDRQPRTGHESVSFDIVAAPVTPTARTTAAASYLARLGVSNTEAVIFTNGVPTPRNEEWLQTMSERISTDLRDLQQLVYEGSVTDNTILAEYFFTHALLRRNPLIIPDIKAPIRIVDFTSLSSDLSSDLSRLPILSAEGKPERGEWVQMTVFSDFGSDSGLKLLSAILTFWLKHKGTEVLFVPLPSATDGRSHQDTNPKVILEKLRQAVVEKSSDEGAYERISHAFSNPLDASGICRQLGIATDSTHILLNGRLIGPLAPGSPPDENDLESLYAYELRKRVKPIATALDDLKITNKFDTPQAFSTLTGLVAASSTSDLPEGIFETPPLVRTALFDTWDANSTSFSVGDKATSTVEIVALLDPTSETAQRWIPILKLMSEMDGVSLRIFLNPSDKVTELPIRRFHRSVLTTAPSFDVNETLSSSHARFEDLPANSLLTMSMDVPDAWLVAPKDCVYDLDNLKLDSLSSSDKVSAVYGLESILVEGHSREVPAGIAPRGVELLLGAGKTSIIADTIIMANLGYFQFKANPGLYSISLRSGRSRQIFSIQSVGNKGYNAQPGDEETETALMSFEGVTLYPRLTRNAGKATADVLMPSDGSHDGYLQKAVGYADQILKRAGIEKVKTGEYAALASNYIIKRLSGLGLLRQTSTKHADINIFSVASGHLYERMLNIMMVSVMRHTNSTVKFWFIEQFLSPSFKAFLPTMATKYGFKYQMVTYKWPHWLRAQKEKQREIWGYKILFLDALFPLDLDKVIFVDADQIVRTDMYDLVKHDLEGAPYGFTPMCDSRTEMEGFRFWKTGYWKSLLGNIPYHISALYVVDLKRFRQIAAGDRLRQQYQQLSADPNSLSNLDQDLPNNMQSMLKIHSLPQEWLWCETWCSDESLADAKTIDLCNNPLTKEPKLDRARRQVPEWTVYDEEIAELRRGTWEARAGLSSGATSQKVNTMVSSTISQRDEL